MSRAIYKAMKAATQSAEPPSSCPVALLGLVVPADNEKEGEECDPDCEKQSLLTADEPSWTDRHSCSMDQRRPSLERHDDTRDRISGDFQRACRERCTRLYGRCHEENGQADEGADQTGRCDALTPRCVYELGDTEHAIGAAPDADSKTCKKRCRCGRAKGKVFAVCLGCVAVLCVAFSMAMAGGWSRRDLFQFYSSQPDDIERICKAVNSGPGVPCGSPWSSLCFDRNRCVGSDGTQHLSVFVHDPSCSNLPSSKIMSGNISKSKGFPEYYVKRTEACRDVAKEKGILAETLEEACVVIYVVPRESECVSSSPSWNQGQNHVLFDFNDETRDRRPQVDGQAMYAQSNMRTCYYRQGHDIAVPLPMKHKFEVFRNVAPSDRKYFATFMGTLYLSGHGHAEREAVRQIGINANASSDVVVLEQCQELHQEHLLHKNIRMCQNLREQYDKANFADLMNTTFSLVPAGRSPATYRLAEALSAGAIPVFIHDNFVKPFPTRIPWSTFSFTFSHEETDRVVDVLRAVPDGKLVEMQAIALQLYDEYFKGGLDNIIRTTYDILEDHLSYRQGRL